MKTANLWKTLLMGVAALAAFTGCSKDDNNPDVGGIAVLTVNGSASATVGIDNNGGTTEAVTVHADRTWTLAYEDEANGSWAVPSVSTGAAGDTQLTFTVDANTGDDRSTVFDLTAMGNMEGVGAIPTTVKITVKQNAEGTTNVETNVAQILTMVKAMNPTTDQSGTPLTDDIKALGTIVGVVTCDPSGDNMGNANILNLQDEDMTQPNSGIELFIPSSHQKVGDTELATGMKISVTLTNETSVAEIFNGMYELSLADETITILEQDIPMDNIPTITAAQMPDYAAQLVKIANVQTQTEYADGTLYSDNAGNANFVDEAGTPFIVRTCKAANTFFGATAISNMSGPILGIAAVYNDAIQLMPRNAQDVVGLTNPRFDIQVTGTTIAEMGTQTGQFEIDNATVVGIHAKGMMIADGTGYVLLFDDNYLNPSDQNNPDPTQFVGKSITVSGAAAPRSGYEQFDVTDGKAASYTLGEASSFTLPAPTAMDGQDVDAYVAQGENVANYQYVTVSGQLTITDSGKGYNTYKVTVAGASVPVMLSYGIDSYFANVKDGDVVNVTGFTTGIYDSSVGGPAFAMMVNAPLTANSDLPFISPDPTSLSFKAAGETKDVTLTTANLTAAVTASVSGTDAAQFSATVDGNTVHVTALENTDATAKSATLTLTAGAATATVALTQSGVSSGAGYTEISALADLTAGDYYMAGYVESYSDTNFVPYSYHFWVGTIDTSSGNTDLATVNYEYADNQLTINPDLDPRDAAKGTMALVTLESAGAANTYYIKCNGQYLINTTLATNRRLGLQATSDNAAWTFSDVDGKVGVFPANNGVWLGSAGATYDLLRSYKTDPSSSTSTLSAGVVFFKAN